MAAHLYFDGEGDEVIRIVSAREATTIRLDDDIILYFKKKAGEKKVGYQTLINAALREFVRDHAID